MMECWLCHDSLSMLNCRGIRRIGNEEMWNVLEDELPVVVLRSLRRKENVCTMCYSLFQILCGHCDQLQEIQKAIHSVIRQMKARRQTDLGHTLDLDNIQNEGNISAESDDEQEDTRCFELPLELKIKEEPIDSDDNEWMESSDISFSGKQEMQTESEEDFQERAYLKNEVLDDDNSKDLDDTTEFILTQMLSESDSSDSESEPEKHCRKVTKKKTSNPKPKSKSVRRENLNVEKDCELCDPTKTFSSAVALSKHYEMDHKDTERTFFCERFGCDETLLTLKLLEVHKNACFDGKQPSTPDLNHLKRSPQCHRSYCNFCLKTSPFPEYLRHHELEVHSDSMKNSCDICGVKYFSEEILDAHKLGHYAGDVSETVECSICSSSTEWKAEFQDAASLDSHLIRMHNFRSYYDKKLASTSLKSTRGDKEPVTCDKCGRIFPPGKSWKTYVKIHKCEDIFLYGCELCSQRFGYIAKLVSHVAKTHEGGSRAANQQIWSCNTCGKDFVTTLMYKRHLNCHNLEKKLAFYCDTCEIRFETEKQFEDHKRVRHSEKCKTKFLSCGECGKRVYTIFRLRKHEREVHPHLLTFQCSKCPSLFSKSEFLEIHLKTHEPVGPYTCSLCPTHSYLTGDKLEKHLKDSHSVGIGKNCDKCGKVFESQTELSHHLLAIHEEQFPVECSICKKRFSCASYLKSHMKVVHISEEMKKKNAEKRRVQCEICQKWVLGKSALANHIKTVHERSTLQVCEICGKSINGAQAMKDHMKIHREEKNFACDFCDKRFVRRDALRMHTYTHTGEKPFGCHICDKRFNQRTPLKRHVETHKKDGTWFPKPDSVAS